MKPAPETVIRIAPDGHDYMIRREGSGKAAIYTIAPWKKKRCPHGRRMRAR